MRRQMEARHSFNCGVGGLGVRRTSAFSIGLGLSSPVASCKSTPEKLVIGRGNMTWETSESKVCAYFGALQLNTLLTSG